MPKINSNPFTQTIKVHAATLVTASSFIAANAGLIPTNTIKLLTAGAEGSIVKAITIASNDGTARNIAFYISTDAGATKYLLGTVPVPANSGFNGTNTVVDMLASSVVNGLTCDQSGRPVLLLEAADEIYIGVTAAAVSANCNIYVVAQVEDF